MSSGRTTWWGKDGRWWGRERQVLLGQEFGTEGPGVMDWLSCEAQTQREGGRVKAGYAAIAHGCFAQSAARVREIVQRAVEIGALDDFTDGEPFTARISGWSSDQSAIRAATRQADKRDRDRVASAGEQKPPQPSHAPSRSVTASHRESHDHTRPDQSSKDDSLRSSSRRELDDEQVGEQPITAENAPLCCLLADLIVENGSPRPRIGKRWLAAEQLLLGKDERDPGEAERLVRWCQASEFWRPNVLSMAKFREKYDTLRLQSQRSESPIRAASTRESPGELIAAIRAKGEAVHAGELG